MTDKVQKIREEVARIQFYTQSEVLKQILDYIDEVQKEPVSIWHDIEELSMARECEYILVIYKDTTSPRVAGNKTQVSYWDRIDKWAYLDDLLKF